MGALCTGLSCLISHFKRARQGRQPDVLLQPQGHPGEQRAPSACWGREKVHALCSGGNPGSQGLLGITQAGTHILGHQRAQGVRVSGISLATYFLPCH